MSRRDRPENVTPEPTNIPDALGLPKGEQEAVAKAVAEASLTPADATLLVAALARVARLHGYSDEYLPEHTGDIDTTGADPRILGLLTWAKTARLP